MASKVGHEPVVKIPLAKEGVNPNSNNKFGQSPLLWTAIKRLLGRCH
jgi:hypothetical protein